MSATGTPPRLSLFDCVCNELFVIGSTPLPVVDVQAGPKKTHIFVTMPGLPGCRQVNTFPEPKKKEPRRQPRSYDSDNPERQRRAAAAAQAVRDEAAFVQRRAEEERSRAAARSPADARMEERALQLIQQDDTRVFFEHVREGYRPGGGDLVGHWKARDRLFGDTGMSPLHVACKSGASRIAATMVSTYPSDYGFLYSVDADSLTPIEVATPEVAQALSTSENVCSVLVDMSNDKQGASKQGALAMIKTAVRVRPKLLCGKDGHNWGSEPAHVAAEYKVEGVMLLFVEAGGNGVMARHNRHGDAPLHVAIRGGHTCIVLDLLRLGDDPNRRTSSSDTALHVAAASHDVLYIIPALLSAGADEKLKNKAGKTPRQLGRDTSPTAQMAFKSHGNTGTGCSCVVL